MDGNTIAQTITEDLQSAGVTGISISDVGSPSVNTLEENPSTNASNSDSDGTQSLFASLKIGHLR